MHHCTFACQGHARLSLHDAMRMSQPLTDFQLPRLAHIQLLCMCVSSANCLSVHRESELDGAAGRDGSFTSVDTTMAESPQVVFHIVICFCSVQMFCTLTSFLQHLNTLALLMRQSRRDVPIALTARMCFAYSIHPANTLYAS